MLVVLPVMLWEISPWIGDPLRRIIHDRQLFGGSPSSLLRDAGSIIVLPAAAAVVVVLLFPCHLPGWDSAAAEAVGRAPRNEKIIDFSRQTPPGVLFADFSTVPWFIDRPVVWSPTQKATRALICDFLDQPEARP